MRPGRPGDEKTAMQRKGGKMISCRKGMGTRNRSPFTALNATRENGTRRSSKRETETEENGLLENRELSCQSPQRAAWDDSRGLTHTLQCLDWYKTTRAALETPERGLAEVCLRGAGLEEAMAGSWVHLSLSGASKSHPVPRSFHSCGFL